MKRAGLRSIVFAAVTIIGMSGCSRTNATNPPSSDRSAAPSSAAVGTGGAGATLESDDDFVRDVAAKNLAEIELSRLALDKVSDPNIKAFAQMMIDEHSAAADSLKNAVSGQSIQWPNQLDDNHRKTAEELKKKQGADFDHEYMEAMVKGHQDFTAKLESRLDVQSVADWKTAAAGHTQTSSLPDPKTDIRDVQVRPNRSDSSVTSRINQWAAETYPVAQKHLDAARALGNASKERSSR